MVREKNVKWYPYVTIPASAFKLSQIVDYYHLPFGENRKFSKNFWFNHKLQIIEHLLCVRTFHEEGAVRLGQDMVPGKGQGSAFLIW